MMIDSPEERRRILAELAVREERWRILSALAKLRGPVIMRTDIEKIVRDTIG